MRDDVNGGMTGKRHDGLSKRTQRKNAGEQPLTVKPPNTGTRGNR